MHEFLVCACKFQDFVQSQEIFAQVHNCETVTFRNTGVICHASHVTCHMSLNIYMYIFFLLLFLQGGKASQWRVHYQQGLPRLVSL